MLFYRICNGIVIIKLKHFPMVENKKSHTGLVFFIYLRSVTVQETVIDGQYIYIYIYITQQK